MSNTHKELPKFTMEDELVILRGVVFLAWICALVMVALELYLRTYQPEDWPWLGNFPTVFNLILAEFTLNTAILTTLLVRQHWYERTPRASVHRLSWLLSAVIIWIGLHYFAVFHILGSLHGPLILILPFISALSLILFPGIRGWAIAMYFILGHLTVVLLESQNLVMNPGQLSQLLPPFEFSNYAVIVLIATLIPSLALGKMIRSRFDETGAALYRKPRLDINSRLYNLDFLHQRLQSELNRARRQDFECSLLLIELSGLDSHLNTEAQSRLRKTVQEVSQIILDNIRVTMDTPANPVFASNVVAILLPDTDLENAKVVNKRLTTSIAQLPTVDNQTIGTSSGLVVINDATNVTADQVMNLAAGELGNSSGELKIKVLPA